MATKRLVDQLDQLTIAGKLYEKLEDNKVRCYACGHRCLIADGKRGICKVRFNRQGTLYVPHGYTAGLQSDPIEKKPLFHVLPGADALTFGMLGCDFHCPFCQNWLTAQTLWDDAAGIQPRPISADDILQTARRLGSRLVVSSYNEPLITAEWAADIFELAKEAGLSTGFVSNGNATPEVIDFLRPLTDCYKVDLKSMRQENYRVIGGKLENVLRSIEMLHENGFWVEVVTLVIPDFNDSDAELAEAAQFLAGISADIPWHVTAFHPDYRMTDADYTPLSTLVRAVEIGKAAGLHYVYAGNIRGGGRNLESTYCPKCSELLVDRAGFSIRGYHVTSEGRCPSCGASIPGIWWSEEELAQRDGLPGSSGILPIFSRRP